MACLTPALKAATWLFLLLGFASAFMTTVAGEVGAETAFQQGTAVTLVLLLIAGACIVGRRKALERRRQSPAQAQD